MLKKPSELFEKKEEILVDQLLEDSHASSKAVKSFRDSVQKINSLSDFSETLDNYQKSIDDVSNLSKEVETLREDIKDLLTSEDLDRAMMGHIVLIDKTISDLQENVKSINEKKLKEIRGSVSSLTASVDEFLEVDAPKYKKLLLDHEKRSSRRYEEFEETVDTAFKDVVEDIDNTISRVYDEITSTVDGINQESFKSLLEDVRDLGKKQEDKYKKIVVDSEVRLDERYASVSNRFEEQYESLQESVDIRCEELTSLIEDVRDLDEKREDKYKKIIVDTEVRLDDRYVSFEESVNIKFEEKYNTLQESVDARCESLTHLIGQLTDQVSLVEGSNSDIIKSLNEKVGEVLTIKRSFSDVKKTFTEQQSELEKYTREIGKEVTSLKADVLRNETHIKNQVSYDEEIDDLKKIITGEAKSNVEFKEEIKSYTKGLDNAVKDTKEAIKKLDLNKVEKQNYELSNKIKHLEELFDSFSEKAILSESIIAEPPSTNNEDPLTPLNQKFVTFDQLNDHYRKFINRIQQQLSSLGGGGEVRLEFLDDVDRDSVKVDGKVLAYQASTGKFIGVTNSGGGGSGITTANINADTLNVSGVSTFQGDVKLGDGNTINMGDNDDFQIQHHSNGTGIIQNAGSGQLQIRSNEIRLLNQATDEDYAFFRDDGAVELYYDNSKKFETTADGIDVTGHTETDTLNVSGVSTFQSNVHLGDGNNLLFGDSNDLQIVHDGSASWITDAGTGYLGLVSNGTGVILQKQGGEFLGKFLTDSSVELYYDNSKKFETTGYGVTVTGISSAQNVSIANTFTYPEYITGGTVPRAIKSQGGYDRTSAFDEYQTGTEASQDPADYIEYTQELADSGTWHRFAMTTAGNQARDNQWWGETNSNYDNTKGLFGGLTAPAGIDHFFDFSENTAFNNAKTTGDLKYTQAVGSFSLKECQVGDLVLARFDFNIMPMVTNTTVQVALIYANRDANDAITFTFPLTITPFFYGSGSVGKGFLLRPTITAYIANQQDINSRSLVAIKADNPVLVNPIGVLFTIQR